MARKILEIDTNIIIIISLSIRDEIIAAILLPINNIRILGIAIAHNITRRAYNIDPDVNDLLYLMICYIYRS